VIAAAKEARDFLNWAGKHLGTSADEIRKHSKDLEGLLIEAAEKSKYGKGVWNHHLEKTLGVAKPTRDIAPYTWHAHHILFKEGLRAAQRELVDQGQDILRKVGIDPLFGKEVLTWAPNGVEDQHSHSTLLSLIEDLRELANDAAPKSEYVKILREHATIDVCASKKSMPISQPT
jgi:hypothetical protein